jgi:hypothetical protein
LLLAIRSAQHILAHHAEPGGLNEEATINALLTVLDDQGRCGGDAGPAPQTHAQCRIDPNQSSQFTIAQISRQRRGSTISPSTSCGWAAAAAGGPARIRDFFRLPAEYFNGVKDTRRMRRTWNLCKPRIHRNRRS